MSPTASTVFAIVLPFMVAAEPPVPVAVPPAADVKNAVDTLRDVFDHDYAAAGKDAKSKTALSAKLIAIAPERKTPAMIFACYDEARRLSAASGDMQTALGAVDALERRFEKVPGTLRRETLEQLAESELDAASAITLAKLAREEAGRALDREEYDSAAALAGIAMAAAKKSLDVDAASEARAFKSLLDVLARSMKSPPDDAAANSVLGAYWIFNRGRWDTGLKFLAKGSDKALADAAARDLAKPPGAKERTALAELWFALAKDSTAEHKRFYIERALVWYSAAVAVATGDDDLKPSVRAREIETAYPDLFNKTFTGHTEAVAALAVTPDGNTLVSVGNDAAARVWDAATGKLVRTLEGHEGWVGSVVITPDGTKAITAGGDFIIRVWDLATGKQTGTLEGHTGAVRGLALAPDGKILVSGSSDKTCRLWDLATGKELKRFGEGKESIECVALSPDGRFVLTGSDAGSVTVFDAKTGSVISTFDKHEGMMVYTIAVTKDGKTAISGARDKMIRIWDIATGNEIRTLRGHTEQVYQVALSPDEKHLLSASFDKTVRLWDLTTGKELRRFEGHTDGVQGVCFAPSGHDAFSASWDKTLRRWRIPQ